MSSDIKIWCKQCTPCDARPSPTPHQRAPVKTIVATEPFQKVVADILELPITSHKWQQVCASCSRLFLQICQPLCHSRSALHNSCKMPVWKLHLWTWNSRNAAHRSKMSIWGWLGETSVWTAGHPENMHQLISSLVWRHDWEIQQDIDRSVSQVTSSTARWIGWLPQPSCFGLQHQPTFFNRFHQILPHTWPWSQDACQAAVTWGWPHTRGF